MASRHSQRCARRVAYLTAAHLSCPTNLELACIIIHAHCLRAHPPNFNPFRAEFPLSSLNSRTKQRVLRGPSRASATSSLEAPRVQGPLMKLEALGGPPREPELRRVRAPFPTLHFPANFRRKPGRQAIGCRGCLSFKDCKWFVHMGSTLCDPKDM